MAKSEKAIFLHLEPILEARLRTFEVGPRNTGKWKFVKSAKDIQPKKTLVFDLRKPEQELLADMTQQSRHNIRLAQRRGVEASFADKYDPVFYKLLLKTCLRDKFKPFPESHYQNIFKVSSPDFKVKLCLAHYQGRVIACHIMILFNKTAVCLHAASDYDFRRQKASHYLQWQKMKLAKELGCSQVDFWGIDEKKWPGLTYFKKTFGGREIIRPQRYDIVFNNFWRRIYKLLSKN